jgi:hypothetical protein
LVTGPTYFQLRDFSRALNADVVKKAARHGGTPPWVKDFAGQLEDPEYSSLTLAERGLLKDLRLLAARRGNKIPDDESYLRAQLRCSSRTALAPKLHRLRALGFTEPYAPATESPAQPQKQSRARLEPVATDSRLEVDLRSTEENYEPAEPAKDQQHRCPMPDCQLDLPSERRLRDHLANVHWKTPDEINQLLESGSST